MWYPRGTMSALFNALELPDDLEATLKAVYLQRALALWERVKRLYQLPQKQWAAQEDERWYWRGVVPSNFGDMSFIAYESTPVSLDANGCYRFVRFLAWNELGLFIRAWWVKDGTEAEMTKELQKSIRYGGGETNLNGNGLLNHEYLTLTLSEQGRMIRDVPDLKAIWLEKGAFQEWNAGPIEQYHHADEVVSVLESILGIDEA